MLEAVAYSSQEAVELGVVDFTAERPGRRAGRSSTAMSVETPGGDVTLDTQGLELRRLDLTLAEQFILFLSNPNVNFILITLGGLGLVIELFNPGLIVPGVVGAMCLILAYVATGQPAGELGGFRLPGSGAAVVVPGSAGGGHRPAGHWCGGELRHVGGLLLFNPSGVSSPTLPSYSVSLWVVLAYGGAILLGGAEAGSSPSSGQVAGRLQRPRCREHDWADGHRGLGADAEGHGASDERGVDRHRR